MYSKSEILLGPPLFRPKLRHCDHVPCSEISCQFLFSVFTSKGNMCCVFISRKISISGQIALHYYANIPLRVYAMYIVRLWYAYTVHRCQ